MPRLQNAAAVLAGFCVLLAIAASAGLGVIGTFGNAAAIAAHIFLLVFGAICGTLARWRVDEIENERWSHVEDELATQGEKEYAHKEAERGRRAASTLFALAPACLAFWLAQETHVSGDGIRISDLLMVTPLVAYIAAFLATGRFPLRS